MPGFGQAGGSAREVAERKRRQAERLLREAEAFESGSDGELAVGLVLDQLPDGFVVLHDLGIPGSRANADHLVVGPTGVWMVDAKNHDCRFTLGKDTLWRGKFPFRRELDTAVWEASELAAALQVPVQPVIGFVRAQLPEPSMTVSGVAVCELRALVAVLSGLRQPLAPAEIAAIVARAAPLVRSRPTGVSPTLPPRRPTQRRPQPRRPRRRRTLAVLGFELAGFLLTACAVIGGAAWMAHGLQEAANKAASDRTTTTAAPTPTEAAPTSTTTEPSASTTVTTLAALSGPTITLWWGCNNPGDGWSFVPVWPGDQPGLSHYSLAWRTPGRFLASLPDLSGADQAPMPVDGIGAGDTVEIQAHAVGLDGQPSDSRISSTTAPSESC